MANQEPTTFTLTEKGAFRMAKHWRSRGVSIHAAAKRHARAEGVAGIWRADGSLLMYFKAVSRDRGYVIRQKTFPVARPA